MNHLHLPGEPRPAKKRRRLDSDLASLVNQVVEIRTVGGGIHRGDLLAVGTDWMVLDLRSGARALVRLGQVVAVTVDCCASASRRGCE